MKAVSFILLFFSAFLSLFTGTVDISCSEVLNVLFGRSENAVFRVIILENRLPQTLTAMTAGAGLAVSGLLMQTVFSNPLAGPSVLGISSASSLGAAVVTFLFSSLWGSFNTAFSVVSGSLAGSLSVLVLLVFLSDVLKNNLTLLISGMMLSYVCAAAVSVLNFFGNEESVKNFAVWSSGSFSCAGLNDLCFLAAVVLVSVAAAFLMTKPLNLFLLGENYAQNLGVSVKRAKMILLLISGVLTAVITAYCGPVSFIGLAVPHIARLVFKTSNHQKILPYSAVLGSCTALACNFLTILPAEKGILPLNAVTPLFGAPVIVYVLLNKNQMRMN
jgi:iron complex transport system permease protein